MDENGFGALILLVLKNYDLVRKLTPTNRHTFCELFSPAAHIARPQAPIPKFSRLPSPQKIAKNSSIFAVFSSFLSPILRFTFTVFELLKPLFAASSFFSASHLPNFFVKSD